MKFYQCQRNPEHIGLSTKDTLSDSPHRGEIICAECKRHIKWANAQEWALAKGLLEERREPNAS